jgi:2-oxo-4-hydroxy-4-carboxy-5-ureidoimidazoline decarboxylase
MSAAAMARLNALPDGELHAALERCCGARRWCDALLAARPYASAESLHTEAGRIWRALDSADWREAFTHHPQIGDVAALRKKFATSQWAASEQRGAESATEATLSALADGNRQYRERFGYIFIVCATGKSADELLALLRARLPHSLDQELSIAAGEQEKILHLRLDKLLADFT